jgi:hypothetical protein
VLAYGPLAIDKEIERLRPAVEKEPIYSGIGPFGARRCILGEFCYYARALKELIGKK